MDLTSQVQSLTHQSTDRVRRQIDHQRVLSPSWLERGSFGVWVDICLSFVVTIIPVFVKFKIMEAETLFSGEGLERNAEVVNRVVAFAGQVAVGENPFDRVADAEGQNPMQSLEEDLDALAEDGVRVPSLIVLLDSFKS